MLHTVAKCYAQYLSTKNNNGVLPGETAQKYFSALARYVHLYYGIRKRECKMEKMVFYVSECCWVESNPDYCVCSRCGEHCEIVVDDSMESDYIPGYDDGEAC